MIHVGGDPMQRRQPRVAVLGAGSWGTAVASIVAVSAPTTIWARSAEVAEDIDRNGRNGRYLGDVALTDGLRATSDMERAVAGAVQNVFAIAAGMGDGAGAGYNTKAMVITRAVREMTIFGEALGADHQTFTGLAGTGDLIVTCTSPMSRNRRVGEELGKG